MSVSAGTYSGGGEGTADKPYRISTPADMNEIGANPDDWDAYFVLVNNIDLAGYTGTEFSIIGSYSAPFAGVFDGNSHTISNFTYTVTDTSYIGIFGYVQGTNAVIEDLTLVAPNVSAAGYSLYVGSLVGYVGGGTITGCSLAGGSVSGGGYYIGGLFGANSSSGTISNCYSSASVSGENYYTGGLVGASSGTISSCYSSGSVSDGDRYSGGLVGRNVGMISNCYAEGSVSGGNYYTGGLSGDNGSGTILNCYSAGSVTGGYYTGGLVGKGGGAVNSFWDTETSGQSQSGGGEGKTTAQMKTSSTFFGWAGCGSEGAWVLDEGQDYPRLAWEGSGGQALPVHELCDFLTGSGTAADPYLIYTPEQLNLVGLFICEWDKHFLLANDIDLSVFSGTEFNLIGTLYSGFTGVFDGNNHTISNFTYSGANRDNIGVLGCTDGGAVIRDLTLVSPTVNTAGYSLSAGSLVGRLESGTITDCGVEGGSVTGVFYVGVLLGANGGTVSNCYSGGSASGRELAGGLVGSNGGTISNSYAGGSVSGYYHLGGLTGDNYGMISNCYSEVSATGDEVIAGLVGLNVGMISNCYAVGSVTGTTSAGGLVGATDYGEVWASFWDVNTTGQSVSAGGEDKTTEQMQMQGTFTEAGWDFIDETTNGIEDMWRLCEDGTDYPKLAWQMIMSGDFVCPDGVEFNDLDVFMEQWLMEKLSADVAISDGDGIVDFVDWAVLADGWQNTIDLNDVAVFAGQWLQLSAYCADIAPSPGGDGVVDMLDFAELADNWLKGVGQ